MSFEPVIQVQGLGKRYELYARPQDRLKQMVLPRIHRQLGLEPGNYHREFWALHDIDFTIARGETVAIIGPNGSGKSTLLQLVCGTLTPTTGTVQVRGRIAALLELGAGFNPEFTGAENVRLSGLLYGMSETDLAQRYDAIVAFAEVGDFIDQPVKAYSSGMYVRLAFAIAAHMDADVLVVDEALSVGDVRFTQKCMRFLREFQQRGTLLFVSHDVGAVTSLCSRAVWLDRGCLCMDGEAKPTVEAYLAEQHARDRAAVGATIHTGSAKAVHTVSATGPAAVHPDVDPRWPALKAAGGGTRLQVFEFNEMATASEFGAREVVIEQVSLHDDEGRALEMVDGGEIVTLTIGARVERRAPNLIFGFYLKDRLGQRLFGDNTYLTTLQAPVDGRPGQQPSARFTFRMPMLPVGAYSFDVAVASGTQDDHTQQHWIHDALTLRATDSSMRHGLVGIPMLDIGLSAGDPIA